MAAKVGSTGAAMDAEFLKRTVGEPLSDALTSLVVAQPADPIEFIGEALLDFIKRKEAESKVSSVWMMSSSFLGGVEVVVGGVCSSSVLVVCEYRALHVHTEYLTTRGNKPEYNSVSDMVSAGNALVT